MKAHLLYMKKEVTFALINYYTVPNARPGRRLGNKVEFRQIDADTYKLFVHARKGDGTETNEGRIYILEKNATEDFLRY